MTPHNTRLELAERLLLGLVGFAFLFGVWSLISSQLTPVQLPSPIAIWNALRADLHQIPGLSYVAFTNQSLTSALAWTVVNVLLWCAVGATVGYAVGMLLAGSKLARDLLQPPLFVLATTPTLVVLPFVLIWFGPTRIAQGSLVIVFTALTVTGFTAQSAARIDKQFRPYARSLGASQRTIMREVLLPGAFPGAAGGLRVSLATAWSLEAVAELITDKNGVGRIIQTMAQIDRTADVIASVVLLCAVAVVIDFLFVLLVKGLTPWMER